MPHKILKFCAANFRMEKLLYILENAMKNLPAKSKRFFILACLVSSLESVAISLSLYYMAQILEFAQAG